MLGTFAIFHARTVPVERSTAVDHMGHHHLVQLLVFLLTRNLSANHQINVIRLDLVIRSKPQEDMYMRETTLLVLNGVQEGLHLSKSSLFQELHELFVLLMEDTGYDI